MKIKQFFYGGDNLAYLLFSGKEALAIDGGAVDEMLAFVAQNNLTLTKVTNTHGGFPTIRSNPLRSANTSANTSSQ